MINYYIKNYERLILPEQDCMILTCWPNVRYIPIRYLICTYLYTEDLSNFNFYKGNPELNCSHNEALICIKKAMENPIQLHYAGPNKPWNSIMVTKQREWFKAMIKTGCLLEYIYSQPMFIVQKIKRYSLRRFIRKHLKI